MKKMKKLQTKPTIENKSNVVGAGFHPCPKQKHINKHTSNIPTSNAAITLIALVITVVVLLILAGVSIAMLTGENGLIFKSAEAREKFIEGAEKEQETLEGYLSIIDGNKVIEGSRTEPWNGATMLTITLSNITGGTFTVNVNNVEASNYGTLYYYVNDTLVYSGTDSSYNVTEVNGKAITDNTYYEVIVLAEPFKIGFTTGEGDNVDAWLACIGNTNELGYTLDNLEKLFKNNVLLKNLLTSSVGIDYLEKSTEKLIPALVEYADFNFICSEKSIFEKVCEKSEVFGKLLENQSFRTAMYNNYAITENVLAKSNAAIEIIKKCTNYSLMKKNQINNSPVYYDGPVYIVGLSQNPHGGNQTQTVYNLISGTSTSQNYSVPHGTNGLTCLVKRFSSKLQIYAGNGGNYGTQFVYAITALKI